MKHTAIMLGASLLVLVPLAVLWVLGWSARPAAAAEETGAFQLPDLPYAQSALEPFISGRTLSFHYGKHHQTYVDNLNKLTAGTPRAKQSLEAIIRETSGQADAMAVFNNAAQVWNHTFFWRSMKPHGGGKPSGVMLERIERSFGSYEGFLKEFTEAALGQFGSGWAWLVQDGEKLKVVKTANADTPIAHGQTPLLTCDVWEHAYYLDYQNRRKDFVQTYLEHLIDWEFAASQIK